MGELYGEVNKLTLEWKDGLMATNVRHCCKVICLSAKDVYDDDNVITGYIGGPQMDSV